MKTHQRLRREAALGILDPVFNLREIAKNLILVEDHLTHPRKRCLDCIRKHLLLCEALAEEAVGLDQGGQYRDPCEALGEVIRKWEVMVAEECGAHTLSQEIRALRKKLVPLVFDPRGPSINRVAHLWLCPHR